MKKVPFIMLMTANAISMLGNIFAMIVIPWFVLQTTGSPAKTGIAGFFTTLASVVAAFLGGAIVDRLGFKKTSIIADLASGVTVALIPLLFATIGLEYWQLLLLVFAGAFLDAPGVTAREALVPELAEMAGMSLERASSTIQLVERGSRMVGAPLAGLLIALIGTQNVLWFDALSFAVSAVMIGMAIPALQIHARASEEHRHFLADLKEGVQFLVRDQLLLLLVLLLVITNFLDAPLFGVVYPVYVQRFFGEAVDLGLLISAGGAGAVLGALLFGAFGHRLPRRLVFFAGFILATLRYWVMILVPPFGIVLTAALISGFGAGPLNPILYTIEYERIPVSYRGRVFGTMTALAFIAMPLGTLIGGYMLEWADVRLVLGLIGACYLATLLFFLFHPATREMNVKKTVEAVLEPAAGVQVDEAGSSD